MFSKNDNQILYYNLC